MDHYIVVLFLAGISSLGMTFMPAIAKRTRISYSLIYVIIGILIYTAWPNLLPSALPTANGNLTVRLTELIVIISLMGTAIKIDRRFSFSNWSSPLRLVMIAMILCISICVLFGVFILGMLWPAAILLGAVLAPTDPVLASDVQVGPPNEKVKSETRFSLTSEAGLNDGMAFPFVWLAIVVANSGFSSEVIIDWLGYHLIYKIAVGLFSGWVCGKVVGYLVFTISEKYKLVKPTDGFLAIALMLCTYGLTELVHGYGFIAVFVSGYMLRHSEKKHRYHEELHSFTDQFERLLLGILLIFYGGTLATGILKPLTWEMVIFSCGFLLLVRPLSASVALIGRTMHWKEKLAISFFGIRGMGSVFYLSFAVGHASFENVDKLWAIVAFTMLVSIVMHGLTATSVMNYLKKNIAREKVPD
jgi:NhaP-type Na+/H+ or K+/H+ antiporter